jgi:putative redox protein
MVTSEVIYKGDMRCSAIHLQSKNEIVTDAPTDNNGKGQAFSPTDLLATSLANCMLTVMGIAARTHAINIDGASAEVTKVMYLEPRRVGEIHVILQFPMSQIYDAKQKQILEHTALTCPVGKSLHPDLKQVISFKYD